MPKLTIRVESPERHALTRAQEIAGRLDLPLAEGPAIRGSLALVAAGARLELREYGERGHVAVYVELAATADSPTLRKAALAGREGVSRVIDATGGLGADAFVLARAGCRVDLVERSPVVAELLADGIARALHDPETRDAAARMYLHRGDARELLPKLAPIPVVYLDPMYPRSGREGGKAKGMRLLRALLGGDEDAGELLSLARAAAGRRVVVKRPARAPPLAGARPSGSLRGKTVRYDLYAPT